MRWSYVFHYLGMSEQKPEYQRSLKRIFVWAKKPGWFLSTFRFSELVTIWQLLESGDSVFLIFNPLHCSQYWGGCASIFADAIENICSGCGPHLFWPSCLHPGCFLHLGNLLHPLILSRCDPILWASHSHTPRISASHAFIFHSYDQFQVTQPAI